MPVYAVTVVNKRTGARTEIEVTAPTPEDAELVAAQNPDHQVGRVLEMKGGHRVPAARGGETTTERLLRSIDRRLGQIFVLLLLVLVVIPVGLIILIAVLSNAG